MRIEKNKNVWFSPPDSLFGLYYLWWVKIYVGCWILCHMTPPNKCKNWHTWWAQRSGTKQLHVYIYIYMYMLRVDSAHVHIKHWFPYSKTTLSTYICVFQILQCCFILWIACYAMFSIWTLDLPRHMADGEFDLLFAMMGWMQHVTDCNMAFDSLCVIMGWMWHIPNSKIAFVVIKCLCMQMWAEYKNIAWTHSAHIHMCFISSCTRASRHNPSQFGWFRVQTICSTFSYVHCSRCIGVSLHWLFRCIRSIGCSGRW